MRYDKLLKARKRREKSLQMRTARLEAAAGKLTCHCRNLRDLWKKAARELRNAILEQGEVAGSAVRARERNLTRHKRLGRRRCRRVNEKLDRVRGRLRDAARSRRLLEKLRRRKQRRIRRKREMMEQKELDSFSAQRYWQRTTER